MPFQCLTEPEEAKPGPPPPVCDGEHIEPLDILSLKVYPSQIQARYPSFFEGNLQPCANGNGCFSQRQRCDFYPDCLDSTDELGCPEDFFFDQCQQVKILPPNFLVLSIQDIMRQKIMILGAGD